MGQRLKRCLPPALSIFLFTSVSSPSAPQFQSRGKHFGHAVETGLLGFCFVLFSAGRKFLFIAKVVHFQRHYRPKQLALG